MPDVRKRADISPGMSVRILEKINRKAGTLTEGVVDQILTDAPQHPYGIMVRLTNGSIGRIKEIVGAPPQGVQERKPDEFDILKLITNGENSRVEFKSSFRYDYKRFQATGIRDANKEVEKSIAKTVAAFLNADGGTLLIGVSDDGNILGIEADLLLLNKHNIDTFRLQLKNSLESSLNDKIVFEHLKIEFQTIDGKNICALYITPGTVPIFVKEGERQECYVRVDNESKPYQMSEFMEYWERRKKNNRRKNRFYH